MSPVITLEKKNSHHKKMEGKYYSYILHKLFALKSWHDFVKYFLNSHDFVFVCNKQCEINTTQKCKSTNGREKQRLLMYAMETSFAETPQIKAIIMQRHLWKYCTLVFHGIAFLFFCFCFSSLDAWYNCLQLTLSL